VATPIGNLEDITRRAVRVLEEVDVIAAEDTRRTAKLLNHLGIRKPIVSYWGEKEKVKAEEVLEKLRAGESVALVSDAGTPGISDPGSVLVRKALSEEVELVPVPGPSALLAALSVSGLSTETFTFRGFLPARKGQRRKLLEGLSLESSTMVFYESPHRIADTLIDMEEILGAGRRAEVFKELTKLHEEAYRGSLSEILDVLEEAVIAGEYVIVLEGRGEEKDERSLEEALREVKMLMKKGKGRKEAVHTVAAQYGMSKKELYAESLRA
jgi:16S rRNA (cytidine1402-2'-O)-methyltransferase